MEELVSPGDESMKSQAEVGGSLAGTDLDLVLISWAMDLHRA